MAAAWLGGLLLANSRSQQNQRQDSRRGSSDPPDGGELLLALMIVGVIAAMVAGLALWLLGTLIILSVVFLCFPIWSILALTADGIDWPTIVFCTLLASIPLDCAVAALCFTLF